MQIINFYQKNRKTFEHVGEYMLRGKLLLLLLLKTPMRIWEHCKEELITRNWRLQRH